MIIAVDFDGTLHMGQYPGIGTVMPDACKVIRQLRQDGHYIIIWTCRNGNLLLDAVNWMLFKGIEFDRINDQHPDNIKNHGYDTRKVYADIYIDDRQVGGLPDWNTIYNLINGKDGK